MLGLLPPKPIPHAADSLRRTKNMMNALPRLSGRTKEAPAVRNIMAGIVVDGDRNPAPRADGVAFDPGHRKGPVTWSWSSFSPCWRSCSQFIQRVTAHAAPLCWSPDRPR